MLLFSYYKTKVLMIATIISHIRLKDTEPVIENTPMATTNTTIYRIHICSFLLIFIISTNLTLSSSKCKRSINIHF
jgi:hypothetical protein